MEYGWRFGNLPSLYGGILMTPIDPWELRVGTPRLAVNSEPYDPNCACRNRGSVNDFASGTTR
jgi:hypothetical protein